MKKRLVTMQEIMTFNMQHSLMFRDKSGNKLAFICFNDPVTRLLNPMFTRPKDCKITQVAFDKLITRYGKEIAPEWAKLIRWDWTSNYYVANLTDKQIQLIQKIESVINPVWLKNVRLPANLERLVVRDAKRRHKLVLNIATISYDEFEKYINENPYEGLHDRCAVAGIDLESDTNSPLIVKAIKAKRLGTLLRKKFELVFEYLFENVYGTTLIAHGFRQKI